MKPAHEVIVELIQQHCATIQTLEKMLKGHVPGSPPDPYVEITRLEKIGGLDALLEALTTMLIPPQKLPAVVEALKQLTYLHCIVRDAIETLEQRLVQEQPAAADTVAG